MFFEFLWTWCLPWWRINPVLIFASFSATQASNLLHASGLWHVLSAKVSSSLTFEPSTNWCFIGFMLILRRFEFIYLQAPLVKPFKPEETRSQRRVRKREEGQRRVIEPDFGEGKLAPFRNTASEGHLLPQYGPGMRPKKKKKTATRQSSGAGSFPTS